MGPARVPGDKTGQVSGVPSVQGPWAPHPRLEAVSILWLGAVLRPAEATPGRKGCLPHYLPSLLPAQRELSLEVCDHLFQACPHLDVLILYLA